jgi:hypothetical protein
MKQNWKLISTRIIDDADFGMLSDRLWRVAMELMLIADNNGRLPPVNAMIWQLRAKYHHVNIAQALEQLKVAGVATQGADGWIINVRHVGSLKMRRMEWAVLRSRLAADVFKRDGRRCARCGSAEDLSIDHIVPLAAGGTHDLDNLQVLCRSCNSSKGAKVNG